MVQTLKNNWLVILAAIATAFVLAVPVIVSAADIEDCLKSGSNLTVGDDCSKTDVSGGVTTVNDTITNVINVFSVIVGIVAVIMLIFGGFRYVTSGGDSGNIGNAKNTILYAIVGLVIVAIAQAVVQFVLSEV